MGRLEADVAIGEKLTRTIESVKLISGREAVDNTVDVDLEIRFVLHGFTVGENSFAVNIF